jgi:hypothetical protein
MGCVQKQLEHWAAKGPVVRKLSEESFDFQRQLQALDALLQKDGRRIVNLTEGLAHAEALSDSVAAHESSLRKEVPSPCCCESNAAIVSTTCCGGHGVL